MAPGMARKDFIKLVGLCLFANFLPVLLWMGRTYFPVFNRSVHGLEDRWWEPGPLYLRILARDHMYIALEVLTFLLILLLSAAFHHSKAAKCVLPALFFLFGLIVIPKPGGCPHP